jgi:superfamily I DNA/RNA helicase
LIGAEEELMPHVRTLDGDGEIEEERRLAYVAVTRAKAHLTISWCKVRAKYGKEVTRERSRFLEGLPEDAVEMLDGDLALSRTPEEKDATADKFRAQIRARLGLS